MSQAREIRPKKIVALPRTRRLSWTAMVVEGGHQVVLSLWVGTLAAVASLAVPGILAGVDEPVQAARTSLDLLGRLAILGCGAGSFLLLTTLLMYLLSMRSTRWALFQAGVILSMTALATGVQVWLAPELADALRADPSWVENGIEVPGLPRFRSLLGTYLALVLVQGAAGIGLILAGARRWYRYVVVRSSAGYGTED